MRILIIEDNSIQADTLTTLLHLEGHAAMFVGDALSALTYLDAPSEPLPECIILDLRLPGLDGEEFLAKLATHPDWWQIPVVVVSAAVEELGRLRQHFPLVRVLPKPFDPDELLDVLKEIEKEQRGGR